MEFSFIPDMLLNLGKTGITQASLKKKNFSMNHIADTGPLMLSLILFNNCSGTEIVNQRVYNNDKLYSYPRLSRQTIGISPNTMVLRVHHKQLIHGHNHRQTLKQTGLLRRPMIFKMTSICIYVVAFPSKLSLDNLVMSNYIILWVFFRFFFRFFSFYNQIYCFFRQNYTVQ